MYAIHIRQMLPMPGRLDINDVAMELSKTQVGVLQHIYAPRSNEFGHSGVLYVTGPSAKEAGVAVLAAVRKVLTGSRMRADLVTSVDPGSTGLCDGTIRVAAFDAS
ncbi:hypothetical protein ACIGQE_11240 [Streptomyces sp. NPDC053429]|uniref:hypothetical protein n=1 Tax=Streptomyces sp. NPDC053429 TaxID=3365702 RepID=UPI0037CF499E